MPKFGLAGAETMCENLTYELVALGMEVVVVSLYDYHSVITKRIEDAGVRVIYLNKKPGFDISMVSKLKKIFRKERPKAIHTHLYVMKYAIPAAILAGVKTRIHTVHNIAQKENSKIARKLNYIFYHFAHVIPVALTEEIKRTIVDEYHMKEDRIPVVFNGINLNKCIPKADYFVRNKFIVLHIGRFSKQKNHVGLIDAFYLVNLKHPKSELWLVGDGEDRYKIEEYVRSKKLTSNVIFLGLQENVYQYLNKADVFILPSLYEGMPMTLIEAMGTGLPIVATAVGGIPDMLTNDANSILVKCNTQSISYALERLIDDGELREKIGKKALQCSNKYSSNMMAREYADIYSNY